MENWQVLRKRQSKVGRWVVKIGSNLLTKGGQRLNAEAIQDWVAQMASLRAKGYELILVSSGAVAAGMARMALAQKPDGLHELQALASIGQMGLMQTYERVFSQYATHTAQVLLTHDDLSHRTRYLNARSTLYALLGYGVVPIINENDVVVTDEFRFGDNDTLAALVANLLEADGLVILTDQQGLFDKDPRQHSDAILQSEVSSDDDRLKQMCSQHAGRLGSGGMLTKVRAAKTAARSGAFTLVASGKEPQVLLRLSTAERIGSLFVPSQQKLAARKRWLLGQLIPKGKLFLDQGAASRLSEGHSSLLSVGVTRVEGVFLRGDLVECVDREGRPILRGLVNYSSVEAERIKGLTSQKIVDVLGYASEQELIHRDNLVMLGD